MEAEYMHKSLVELLVIGFCRMVSIGPRSQNKRNTKSNGILSLRLLKCFQFVSQFVFDVDEEIRHAITESGNEFIMQRGDYN